MLAMLAMLVMPAPAAAQVIRNFAPRFTTNQPGQVVFVANTIMTCSTTGVNGGNCVNARNGIGGVINDNDFNAQYIDIDSDPTTFNSSSATLTIPPGSSVVFAGLYWGAYWTAGANGGTQAPDITQRGVVKLATPTAGYQTITASQLDIQDSSYQGFRDVTGIVQQAGAGTYTVANVQAGLGSNRNGGWALVIVLHDPSQPLRNLTVFDGFALVSPIQPTVTINVSGFITPAVGPVNTSVGFVSYEGDLGLIGDGASLNGTALTDALHPANNFFNSSITNLGTRVTTKNPDYINQLGFDASIVDATGILGNGATGATIAVTSSGDTYYPGVVTFATQIFSPDLNGHLFKDVTDLNGGTILPGDTLLYTISATNAGQDGAENVTLIDTIPPNTSYVPGTMRVTAGANPGPRTDAVGDDQGDFDATGNRIIMRLGTGATNTTGGALAPGQGFTATFRVVVFPSAPEGAVIANQAHVTYSGQTLPNNFLSLTDGNRTQVGDQPTTVIVTRPDMTINKTNSPGFVQGGTGTYTLRVSNVGTFQTFPNTPVFVVDTMPPSLTPTSVSGNGWACAISGQIVSCSRNSVLAIGAFYPDITLGVTISFTAPAVVTNTAWTSGGGESNTANDASSDPTPIQGLPDLAIIKAHAAPFSVGSTGVYTISVTNVGRGPTTSTITVTDTLPTGLTYISAVGSLWTCADVGQIVTCTTPQVIQGGGTTSITLSVAVAAAAIPNTVNIATVKTAGDNDPSNDRATDPTAVTGVVDVGITKTHTGGFTVGTNGVYTITVTNTGTLNTTGGLTVTDNLPNGLGFVSGTGTGWSCTATGQTVTCTQPAILAPAQTSVLTLTVSVAAPAVPAVTNVATVSTPGDQVASNNTAQDPTTVTGVADVAIVKTHIGAFTVGANGTFRFAVSNVGTNATSGQVTVHDTLPNGLTFVSGAGSGWGCTADGQLVTCTNAGPFKPNDTTSVTLTVAVGMAAVPMVSNTASITTPGDTVLAGNNVSTDANIPVGSDFRLAIQKQASKPEAGIGDVVDYIVTIQTLGASPVPDVVLNDLLPTGFSYQRGSARVNGVRIADPPTSGPALAFPIGTVSTGSTVTVLYRTLIGSRANFGVQYNKAQAVGQATNTLSNIAQAPVRVDPGVFTDRGIIVGKVYAQCECGPQGVQGPNELGIPGVRIYLEDGTSTITDVMGKYDFYNVSPRLHVIRIDQTTLPKGAKLVVFDNRNAKNPASRFVDMTKGELIKVDFIEGSHSPDVLAEVRARRDRGEVYSALPSDLTTAAPPPQMKVPPPPGTPTPTPPGSGATPGGVAAGSSAAAPAGAAVSGASAGGAGARGGAAPATPAAQPNATPAVPMTGGTTLMGETSVGYQGLLPQRTLDDGNSQLPPRPLDAAKALGATGAPTLGTLTISVPPGGFPADGNTAVPVTVKVTDASGAPVSARTVVTLETTGGRWSATDIDSLTPGTQVALVGGTAQYGLIAPSIPDTVLIRATAGALSATQRITFLPVLRPLIGMGVVEGRINLRSLTAGGMAPANPQDGFEQQLTDFAVTSDDGNFTAAARAALLLKGKILGSYLLTLAYDSEHDPDKTLFRDIQPDEFYPVYGDAGVKEFDAQSSEKLYVRIDKGRSYVMYGDYATPKSPDTRVLSAYDRTLTGGVGHLEGKYGQVDVFGSQGHERQIIDEIPGEGISGPYTLSHSDGILNSERVEILTRDRNQPSIIISTVPQTRFADYTIEPFAGRLLFRVPVPALDANLNPISIRVTYEVDEPGDAFWMYGVDGKVRIAQRLELGGTFARNEDPAAKQQLFGFNGTIEVAKSTYLIGEFAQSNNEGEQAGDAERVELRHHSSRLDLRAYAARSDVSFDNPSSTFGPGQTEMGTHFTILLDAKTSILGDAIRTQDLVNNGVREGAQLSVQRKLSNRFTGEIGYRVAHETGTPVDSFSVGTTPTNTNAIRGKLTARVADRASVFGEFEQDILETVQHRAALGGEYLFGQRGRFYIRHEWITAFAGPYALNTVQNLQNTVVGVDADYLHNNQVFSEYRARDAFSGREAEAAIGLRNRWPIKPGLVINTSFERVMPVSDVGNIEGAASPTEATAITGAVEYTANPLWKLTGRLEWRSAPSGDNFLGTLGYAHKVSTNFTMLFRSMVDQLGTDQWREVTQFGIAYRQTNDDKWNALARYENHYDENDQISGTNAHYQANVITGVVNFQPTHRLVFSFRYAGKLADDHSDSLVSYTNAQLVMLRTTYDITPIFDVGVAGSVMFTNGTSSRYGGAGAEFGWVFAGNMRAALGYNVWGFHDNDLTSAGYTNRGLYLDLSYKFDETLFAPILGAKGNVTTPPASPTP